MTKLNLSGSKPATRSRMFVRFATFAAALLVVCFVWLGKIGAGPGTDPMETIIGRVLTFLYFAFFITMPLWTKFDKTKPVPERVTMHD